MQRESCCCPLLPFSWTHIPRIPTARSAYRATTNPLCHPSLVVVLVPVIFNHCPSHLWSWSLSSLFHVPVIFYPCPCHSYSLSLSSLILVSVIAFPCPYHLYSLFSPLFVSGLNDQSANRATNILYPSFLHFLLFLVLHSVQLALGKEFFKFLILKYPKVQLIKSNNNLLRQPGPYEFYSSCYFLAKIFVIFVPRPLFHHSRLVCQRIKALAAISVPVYHASHSRVTKKNLFIILRYYFSQTLLSMEKENLREHTGRLSHFGFFCHQEIVQYQCSNVKL